MSSDLPRYQTLLSEVRLYIYISQVNIFTLNFVLDENRVEIVTF